MSIEIPKKYVDAYVKKYGKDADLSKLEEIYKRSLITPGEDVGVIAAQSIGEASTQLTLRTKHTAGLTIINTTSGLPRLVEIFDAKKDISTPTMNIYLKEDIKKSKQKVLEFANKLIEIKMNDIISSYTISARRNIVDLTIDKEALDAYGLSIKDIEGLLEANKLKFEVNGNHITIKDKSSENNVKKLIRLRNKVVNMTLFGVHGISRAILEEDNGEYYVKTFGTNLKEILEMPEVDVSRTYSNDIVEVSKVLGIEAARNLIISEVKSTLDNVGLTVDIRHIMLIADAMCFDGTVKGIGRYGLSGETDSVFARASFEVPIKHIFDASLSHETDLFNYVANNIISNQVIPVGTGAVKLVVKGYGRKDKEENAGENKE